MTRRALLTAMEIITVNPEQLERYAVSEGVRSMDVLKALLPDRPPRAAGKQQQSVHDDYLIVTVAEFRTAANRSDIRDCVRTILIDVANAAAACGARSVVFPSGSRNRGGPLDLPKFAAGARIVTPVLPAGEPAAPDGDNELLIDDADLQAAKLLVKNDVDVVLRTVGKASVTLGLGPIAEALSSPSDSLNSVALALFYGAVLMGNSARINKQSGVSLVGLHCAMILLIRERLYGDNVPDGYGNTASRLTSAFSYQKSPGRSDWFHHMECLIPINASVLATPSSEVIDGLIAASVRFAIELQREDAENIALGLPTTSCSK